MPIQISWKFYHQKWKFSDIFHISAQNIDCWHSLEPHRRGGSNEYPQSMFLSRNKKIMHTPVNPSFTIYICKWGLRGSKLYRHVFVMIALVHNQLKLKNLSANFYWRPRSSCGDAQAYLGLCSWNEAKWSFSAVEKLWWIKTPFQKVLEVQESKEEIIKFSPL